MFSNFLSVMNLIKENLFKVIYLALLLSLILYGVNNKSCNQSNNPEGLQFSFNISKQNDK